MIKPKLINRIQIDGINVEFHIHLAESFDTIENITQAYALVLNESEDILLVAAADKKWQLPGGAIEEGESPVNTLIRELDEEAAIVPDLNSIKPFFYQEVYEIDHDSSKIFGGTQVRFICRPDVINEFVEDPDNAHIKYHKWTKLEDLDKYLQWGPTAKFIQEHLPDYL